MVFNSLFSKQKLFPHRFHQRCVCSLSYVQREWLIVIATTELYNKQVESLVRNNNKHLFSLISPWFGVSADLGWTGPISTVSVVSCKSAGLPRIVSAGSSALWTTWSLILQPQLLLFQESAWGSVQCWGIGLELAQGHLFLRPKLVPSEGRSFRVVGQRIWI